MFIALLSLATVFNCIGICILTVNITGYYKLQTKVRSKALIKNFCTARQFYKLFRNLHAEETRILNRNSLHYFLAGDQNVNGLICSCVK